MLDLEIAPVDIAFAKTLLKQENSCEEHASFLAFLLASARSGALFIDIEEMPEEIAAGAKTATEPAVRSAGKRPALRCRRWPQSR